MSISPTSPPDLAAVPPADDVAVLLLARHQDRRRQGVPTLTVLAEAGDAAKKLVRRWAESEARTVCEPSSLEPSDAIASWVAALDAHFLTAGAYVWLACQVGRAASELVAEVRGRSEEELAMFLDRIFGGKGASPVAAACRALIGHGWLSGSTTSGLWQRLLDACDGDVPSATEGVTALVGDERTPVLYAAAGATDSGELRTVVARAALLVSLAPAMPIVVSADPERIEGYLATASECRALALLREGLVWLADDRGREASCVPQIARTPVRIDAEPTRQQVSCKPAKGPEDRREEALPTDDLARSAAERYLYERLESHAETAGLFELNGLLAGAGGGRTLEVDLLARSVRVAVEIDGYYHFTDSDAYRRDREKDLLLQHAGYFVVRCLADDVASRLEEILATIIAAVRRPAPGQGRAP